MCFRQIPVGQNIIDESDQKAIFHIKLLLAVWDRCVHLISYPVFCTLLLFAEPVSTDDSSLLLLKHRSFQNVPDSRDNVQSSLICLSPDIRKLYPADAIVLLADRQRKTEGTSKEFMRYIRHSVVVLIE